MVNGLGLRGKVSGFGAEGLGSWAFIALFRFRYRVIDPDLSTW